MMCDSFHMFHQLNEYNYVYMLCINGRERRWIDDGMPAKEDCYKKSELAQWFGEEEADIEREISDRWCRCSKFNLTEA